jgi:hypothetical protein
MGTDNACLQQKEPSFFAYSPFTIEIEGGPQRRQASTDDRSLAVHSSMTPRTVCNNSCSLQQARSRALLSITSSAAAGGCLFQKRPCSVKTGWFRVWGLGNSRPDVKTCQKFSGETKAKQEGGIMKNEMLSLLLDEKICFLKRLPPDTLQNFWQLITV